jgi:hypothetical protein
MNFSAFYDDLLIDAPRCPVNVALQALRFAVREMCEKSRIWTYTTDAEPALANVNAYEIDIPDGSEVVAILGGYFNDSLIEHRSADELDQMFGQWQITTGTPQYVTHNAPWEALVVPYPDQVQSTDTLRWRVALRPTLTATSFDSDSVFANDFYEDFLNGAKARLLGSPGKPYSNLQMAEAYGKRWLAGVNRARIQALRSRGGSSAQVQLPRTP